MRMFAALAALLVLSAAVWLWSPWNSSDTPGAGAPANVAADEDEGATPEAAKGDLDAPASAGVRTEVSAAPDLAGDSDTGGRAITGRIVDELGRPIAGARVLSTKRTRWFNPKWMRDPLAHLPTASGTGLEETVSDAQGRFRLPLRNADDESSVVAVALGYGAEKVDVPATAGTDIGDIKLTQGVLAYGTVLDTAGRPLDAAIVREVNRDGEFRFTLGDDQQVIGGVRTNANGEFRILIHEPGKFAIEADHPEFVAARTTGMARARGDAVRGLSIRLGAAGVIAGHLTGHEVAKPGMGYVVRAQRKLTDESKLAGEVFVSSLKHARISAEVDPDGSFQIDGLDLSLEYQLAAFEQSTGRSWLAPQVTEVATARPGDRSVQLHYATGVYAVFRAVDADSGRALDSVMVEPRMSDEDAVVLRINGGHDEELRAGEDGVFRVGPLRSETSQQTLTLTIRAKGYAEWQQEDLRLPTGGELDLGVVRLRSAPILRVVVTGPAGTPVEGARVSFTPRVARPGPGESVEQTFVVRAIGGGGGNLDTDFLDIGSETVRRGETDENGVCELTVEAGTSGRIRVRHREYAKFGGDSFTGPVHGSMDREVQLTHGGKIVARAVDANGERLTGSMVECRPLDGGQVLSEETNTEGVAQFERLNAGEFGLTISDADPNGLGTVVMGSMSIRGDSDADRRPRLKRGESLATVRDEQTTAITLQQAAKSKLVGVVTVNGEPLDGARIRVMRRSSTPDEGAPPEMAIEMEGFGLFGNTKRDRTDAFGRFAIDDVDVGEITLSVKHRARAMASKFDFTAIAGETRCDLSLSATKITGQVVDERGQPVSGARVSVERAQEETADNEVRVVVNRVSVHGGGHQMHGNSTERTDSQGQFELEGVESGVPLVLRIASRDFADATSEPLTLRADEQRDGIVVTVRRGGNIEIEVENTSAADASMLFVMAHPVEDPTAMKNAMISAGRGKLTGLAPGRWNVILRAGQGGEQSKEVDVVVGETARARFSR